MGDKRVADDLAERTLADATASPDMRMLARRLLERRDLVQRMEEELQRLQDPHGDLVNANRDTILRIHEEGLARVSKIVKKYTEAGGLVFNAVGANDCRIIWNIIKAVNTFHPMHAESWVGWPEGS